MKEENIRPENLMRENEKLHNKDMQEFLSHKNKFIEIPCPACESRDYRRVFSKKDFTFVMCTKCETVFINPRPTLEMLKKYYATSKSIKHWNDKIFPASEDARRNQIFAPRAKKVVEICTKFKVEMKILVDVGAGFGTFCEEIKKMSIFDKVIAVEPSHALAETCRRKGLDVIEKPIENVKDAEIGVVSVITNFELIEHLYCSKDFLLSCSKALPKGGMIILTTPNIKGFDLLVLSELSDNIGGPNHLNYFHPESLGQLLSKCNFEVIDVETPGKLDAELVRKKILAGDLSISNQPFLKHVLIDQWETIGEPFQHFLSDNRLSSHLWIVARKV
jgi:2-polyprenyl-3-methyl-5-hydroxy-6-metoxy-1,4-benzoquinol methylase/ribosomal protein S27E